MSLKDTLRLSSFATDNFIINDGYRIGTFSITAWSNPRNAKGGTTTKIEGVKVIDPQTTQKEILDKIWEPSIDWDAPTAVAGQWVATHAYLLLQHEEFTPITRALQARVGEWGNFIAYKIFPRSVIIQHDFPYPLFYRTIRLAYMLYEKELDYKRFSDVLGR